MDYKEIFTQFSLHSRLQVNTSKSRNFFSSGVPRRKVSKISFISTIRSTSSLEKYIGFPMIKERTKKADFEFILDKMQNRLASWKSKLLNKARRVTLARSVLNAIPSYYVQVHWLPTNICNNIDKTIRNFIWKGMADKGIHLVGWDKVTLPKKDGGLVIRPAREANIAMLGRLVWDLHSQVNKLWVQVLHQKYVKNKEFLEMDSNQGFSYLDWYY